MRARKPSGATSGRSSGRLGLAVLVATAAAFLLVPVTQAAASGVIKVAVTGAGSGTVKSVTNFPSPEPPIKCPTVCEGEMKTEAGFTVLAAFPASGSEFTSWTIKTGTPVAACNGGPEEEEAVNEIQMHAEEEPEVWGEYDGLEGICYLAEENTDISAAFIKAPTVNLEVVIETGEGTVVSNPAGISCEPTCSHQFTVGEKVTLTASPAPGYLFKNWKKCDTGGVNGRQCTVTITEGLKVVGANFYKAFELKGSKSGGLGIMSTAPGGINCGYACTSSTALYKEAALTVKAKPAKHFHFVKFQNGTGSASSCNGVTSPECTIATFSSNSALEEVYAEDTKNTLSVSKEGGGQGFIKTTPANINCGYTCTAAVAQFYADETAAITVTLNKGTTSVTWVSGAGTCTGNALTCSVPMSASHSLVAKFN